MKKILMSFVLFIGGTAFAQSTFELIDIYGLEYVSNPVISPDGSKIIYTRNFKDIMTDRDLSNLWIIQKDGSMNRPLTTGNQNDFSPIWSKDGREIVYKSNKDGSVQLYRRWLDTGAETKLTNLQGSTSAVSWSKDGKWLAFTMFVPDPPKVLGKLPSKPNGAKWNDPAIYIDEMKYRSDGAGYLKPGSMHLFILSIEGGTPRQLTSGDYSFSGAEWSMDGRAIFTSSNVKEDRDYNPTDTEIFKVSVSDGSFVSLTSRPGPDSNPQVSPNGSMIAYLGFDEQYKGYQLSRLYVMNIDGTGKKEIVTGLDRSINSIDWSGDGKGIYFQYEDQGDIKVGYVTLAGKYNEVVAGVSGLSLGRPYSAGQFSVSSNEIIAYTYGDSQSPSDLGVFEKGSSRRLTRLNEDLFGHKATGKIEEIWYESGFDKQKIQGWICYPPGFDKTKKYPLILEIHGGPFTSYGPWYSAEVQLYAAAGYVVLYTNPRGSTSYGEKFGNLIHHNYPGEDYDDLMSGVDAVIEKGFIDEKNLFVTGGSGGGVLTAWIVGNTNRFRAAVVAKPVINWYSFVLYSDNPAFFYKYWFPGLPWENEAHYMKRSPISLVGNVTTPTMLLVGESDYRTPIAES
ncbi:MAG: S9 family peptidase, partial [Cyclobacteriaceae bacterium]|nr:S9 family peptidase [Cyclobacteriaceae bacterium]